MTSEFTDEERAAMTPAELEMADWIDSVEDPDEADGRYGDLPYNEVIDALGHPIINPAVPVRHHDIEVRTAAAALADIDAGDTFDPDQFRARLEEQS